MQSEPPHGSKMEGFLLGQFPSQYFIEEFGITIADMGRRRIVCQARAKGSLAIGHLRREESHEID